MTDMVTISIVVGTSWMVHMSKPIELYTVSMCSLLYINYTTIKLFLKN